ncbi:energy-coupling factor transport system permease protein [Methanohalophilus levihalophilus]|uniref:energy-coupling factor transporter transmembrane component T family protein n=1 Tax=Methanohalophilus levihalophilus TaxID=1431282 RepID=UPI001AE1BD8F|nr:energy-coupling factor transporter transmembrane component T [Methanohalophilus levihalophilus]MBP2030067.1 energy-coupling factor transport system permease protein [Methanohalophilus levihalophilus]
MRKYISFGFINGDSAIHNLDPRTKLFSLIVLSILIFRISSLQNLFYPLLLFIGAAHFSGTSLKQHVLSVRPLLPFLIAIFLFHFLMFPGTASSEFHWSSFSQEGLLSGSLVVGRFVLLILFASLFSATTSAAMLALGIESILKPIPVHRAGITTSEIATMMALSVNLVPLLLRYMEEVRDAQLSRGLGNRFMISGIFSLVIPFFSGSLRLADDISVGMESRCYHGGPRTQLYEMKFKNRDRILTAIAAVFLLGIVLYL